VGQWKSKHHGNVTKAPVKLSDLFRYYNQLPHQMAAIVELEAALLKVAPDALNRDQPWFKTWSQAGNQDDYGPAVKLIKEFEGCHFNAYADPYTAGALPPSAMALHATTMAARCSKATRSTSSKLMSC
jgi:hypothetical protein